MGIPWVSVSPQRSLPESLPKEIRMPGYSVAGSMPVLASCVWSWVELTLAATGCHLCKRTITAVALAAKGSWTTGTLPAVGGT